jgi:hypothetical protein
MKEFNLPLEDVDLMYEIGPAYRIPSTRQRFIFERSDEIKIWSERVNIYGTLNVNSGGFLPGLICKTKLSAHTTWKLETLYN